MRHSLFGVMFAGLSLACGHAEPEVPTDPRVAAGSESEHTPPPASEVAPAACPPRYGMTARCEPGAMTGPCAYPEGTCTCGTPTWCGGAAPPPMAPRWICEAPTPPCPAAGTPCTGAGTCSDGACPWMSVVSCVDGVWMQQNIPPPP